MDIDTSITTIQRTSLSEQTYNAIKQLILGLRLRPGQTVTEVMLCDMLNISKSPVRSALIHLQRDGLVTMTPYKDTIVATLDLAQVRHLYEVRSLIEPYVVSQLAPILQEADYAEVSAILDSADRALAEEDFATFFGINTKFHGFFIKRHGNEFIWRTYEIVDYQMTRIRMISTEIANHPQKQMLEHREIFNRVKERDSEGSAAAMNAHIRGYFDDLIVEIRAGRIDWFNHE